MKKAVLLAAVTCLLLLPIIALCEQARNITAGCVMSTNVDLTGTRKLTDGNYKTSYHMTNLSTGYLQITAPEGETIGALYLCFSSRTAPFVIAEQDENGKWPAIVRELTPDYQQLYVALPHPVSALRIRSHPKDRKDINLSELRIYSPGEPADDIHRWEAPPEKADLLLIAAHPDDEVVFMGGVLPTYAGEQKRATVVAVLMGMAGNRNNEFLDSLWTCGVRTYPVFGPFDDYYCTTLQEMLDIWGENRVLRFVEKLYRQYRPNVVVTHGVRGEYGHGAHRAAAYAARYVIKTAAQGTRFSLPAWQVKKLYLHMYVQNKVVMDWSVPLPQFGGQTALEVSRAAFACHVSQQQSKYQVYEEGSYSCMLYGLSFSSVGADTACNDFFEHINGMEASAAADDAQPDTDMPA